MTPRELANQATVREAAEIVGVPLSTIKRAVSRGDISHHTARVIMRGRHNGKRAVWARVVDLSDVEAYFAPRVTITGRLGEVAHLDAPTAAARLGTSANTIRTLRARVRRRSA
jgi:excisionase family DNA binding protein